MKYRVIIAEIKKQFIFPFRVRRQNIFQVVFGKKKITFNPFSKYNPCWCSEIRQHLRDRFQKTGSTREFLLDMNSMTMST